MSRGTRRPRSDPRRGESGQALYEFAIIVPVLFLLLMGMLEFGFVFLHHLTLEYATREGARAGAAMADGSVNDSRCNSGNGTIGAPQVDPLIIAAVQRVLTSTGSQLTLSDGTNGIPQTTITIYQADADGNEVGPANTWAYTGPQSGVPIPCQVPVAKLDFTQGTVTWPAAGRNNGPTPDSIGVAINYTYVFQTPLDGIMGFVSGIVAAPRLAMSDRTVMALEPTK